jgi:hypothetical protein
MSDGRSGDLLLQGRGTAPGAGCGPLVRNHPGLPSSSAEGKILVAERATPEDVGRILASSGTLTLGGAVLSHVSLLSREFDKPSVSLGSGCPVRLLPPGEGGLLELADVVGSEATPILEEGEVVVLDGDAGIVRVPGGSDPIARARVRRVHTLLLEFGEDPEDDGRLATLLEATGPAGGPAFDYVLEAGFRLRLVPAGNAARRLLTALRSDRSREEELERRLEEMREAVLSRARQRCARGMDDVLSAEGIDDLDRAIRRLKNRTDRDRLLLVDLGGDPSSLDARIGPVLESASGRRDSLRRDLDEQVREAIHLPESALKLRMGGIFQLLRRARAARVDEEATRALQERLARHVAEERSRAGRPLVVSLRDDPMPDRSLLGGKAAGLLESEQVLPEGTRTPRGFVVTSAAYRLHLLGETGEKLRTAFEDGGDETTISRKARAAILAGEIPREVALAVEPALENLGSGRVAIRSSATIEDGPGGSLAGQFDTFLGVKGLPEVLDRIRQAWASLMSSRALRTMATLGEDPLRVNQAVLVQEMVETRSAGVLVTREPSGRPDALLVNANWGLGEGVSQGAISGDLFWVRRSTGELIASDQGGESVRIALDPNGAGTIQAPLDPALADRPCLSIDQLSLLAALARNLDQATGRALDVEFGFTGEGALVIFQVRRVLAGPGR